MTKATKAKRTMLSALSRSPKQGASSRPSEPVAATKAHSRAIRSDIIIISPAERPAAATITSGGRRFSIHQIGSMFGSE